MAFFIRESMIFNQNAKGTHLLSEDISSYTIMWLTQYFRV
ncbi:hypothetical protein SVI_0870 [Shewanella violacea DSS12]|uniref:Uncharacterized protein n=1 Tax=Shewanella violacea (strain JCM 10179 / CIP 106290 / LMG 19151 / DSS12) TaxID=637905 RepID=D4ZGP2_SHEVD|nr:hypothetical protein SVI_0870 [Shewanella violacea DSS12]